MKKTVLLAVLVLLTVSCRNTATRKASWGIDIEQSENSFSWQNSVAGFSISLNQGEEALSSMGFNIWIPNEESDAETSMGFDGLCLGIGGSAPLGTSGFYYPEEINRRAEVLMHSPERAVMAIFYPEYYVQDARVSLSKQVTMTADNPFIQVIDSWSGDFEALNVVAGFVRGDSQDVTADGNVLKVTYRNSLTVVIVMPEAEKVVTDGEDGHAYLGHMLASGEDLFYYVGIFQAYDPNIDRLVGEILAK